MYDRTKPPPEDGYWLTVVPAYNRDYKSAEVVVEHWLGGKDFQIADVSSPWNGAYTSCRDHPGPNVTIKIRYFRHERFVLVRGGKVLTEDE
jgi:hypothetical protein